MVLTALSIIFQQPIADAVGVKHFGWAAAVGIPAGCLYLEVSLLRGALQGIGDYKGVGISLIGEQSVRLVSGAVLAATFLGVTGAYLGSLISYIAMSLYCVGSAAAPRASPEHPGRGGDQVAIRLWAHVKTAWAPIAGLGVIAVLQNIDIIAAKHRFPTGHGQRRTPPPPSRPRS